MDAVVFLVIALVFTYYNLKDTDTVETVNTATLENESEVNVNRVAKVNDTYYEDLNAFSEIINALGFPKE